MRRKISSSAVAYHEISQLLKGRSEKVEELRSLTSHDVKQLFRLHILVVMLFDLKFDKRFNR